MAQEDIYEEEERRTIPAVRQSLATVKHTSDQPLHLHNIIRSFPDTDDVNAKFGFFSPKFAEAITIKKKIVVDCRMEALVQQKDPTWDEVADWASAEAMIEEEVANSIDGKKANSINELHQKITSSNVDQSKKQPWRPWRRS